jgi:hypothetical protein
MLCYGLVCVSFGGYFSEFFLEAMANASSSTYEHLAVAVGVLLLYIEQHLRF